MLNMFKPVLVLATALITITSAAPYVRLAPPTTFSSQSSTLPSRSVCGQPGNLPYAILSHPMISLGELAGVAGSPACASHCLSQQACVSFSYNQINGSCSTFTESLTEMSFHRNTGPIFWWDRMCFERHGDWLGEEDDRDLSMVNGRIRPLPKGKVSKDDLARDAVDDIIEAAIVRRPAESQYARMKLAKKLAQEASAAADANQDDSTTSGVSRSSGHVATRKGFEGGTRRSSLFEHGEQVKLDQRYAEKPKTRRGSRWSVPATEKQI